MTTKTMNVKGTIVNDDMGPVYDFFKKSTTYPSKFMSELPEDNGDIEVNINSGGGIVDAGAEIYTALRNYPGHVKVNVVGQAASAASIIAMAGDEVVMSPVAQMMIHNVSADKFGDDRDHEHMAKLLKSMNESLASAYVAKTGLSQSEVLKLMNDETWLNAKQAVEKHFADSVMFDKEEDAAKVLLTASADTDGMLSLAALQAGREAMLNAQPNKPTPPSLTAKLSGGTTTVTGTAKPNAYIKADNKDGKQVAESKADGAGKVSFTIKGLKVGDELRITQTDGDNGTSKPAVITVSGEKQSSAQSSTELLAQIEELKEQIKKSKESAEWHDYFFNAQGGQVNDH